MVKEIHKEIIPHMAGEEAALYPALKNTKKGREIAMESLEEHQVAEKVLRELIGLPGNLENFPAKASVLEESEVFNAFKKEISSKEAGDILDKFQEEKSNTKASME
jgi:Mn-dependent DtxR family transcriptional regulator